MSLERKLLDLIRELDHSEHEGENEERSLTCRHEKHRYEYGRPFAPCSDTQMAQRLRELLD